MLSNGTTIDKHNSLLFTIGDNDTIQGLIFNMCVSCYM